MPKLLSVTMLHRHGSRGPGGLLLILPSPFFLLLFFLLLVLFSLFSFVFSFVLFIASELTPWGDDHPIKSQWKEEERENLSSIGRLQVISFSFSLLFFFLFSSYSSYFY